jgi:flavin-binding protein dodecin
VKLNSELDKILSRAFLESISNKPALTDFQKTYNKIEISVSSPDNQSPAAGQAGANASKANRNLSEKKQLDLVDLNTILNITESELDVSYTSNKGGNNSTWNQL